MPAHRQKTRRRDSLWRQATKAKRDILAALLIVLFFSIIEDFLRDSTPIDWLKQLSFQALHHALGTNQSGNLPVVIVDITHMPTESEMDYSTNSPLAGFREGKYFSDRRVLFRLVARVARLYPRAVGIDIDFSPEFDGTPPPPKNPQFMNQCLNLTNSSGDRIPVYLGVIRGIGRGTNAWLGGAPYASMAAACLRVKGHNGCIVGKIFCPDESVPLYSLSQRLADTYLSSSNQSRPYLPQLVRALCVSDPVLHMKILSPIEIHIFDVNFHFLDLLTNSAAVVPAERILSAVPGTPDWYDLQQLLQGKLVLVGAAAFGETTDVSDVPGQSQLVPNIFVHGCAVCTLILTPLSEMSPIFGSLLAVLISLLFILFIHVVIAYFFQHRGLVWAEVTANLMGIILACSVAFALAWWLQILWLDFIAVIIFSVVELYMTLVLGGIFGKEKQVKKREK